MSTPEATRTRRQDQRLGIVAGPTGPMGPPGPTGATGPAGADGADGADGTSGDLSAALTGVSLATPGPLSATSTVLQAFGFLQYDVTALQALRIQRGSASPEASVSAPQNTIYIQEVDSSTRTVFLKDSTGTGSTGWVEVLTFEV